MRRCPKCSAEYADSDIRTMCGSCLVPLVTVAEAAAPPPTAPAGPLSVGPPPSAMPTITMPTIQTVTIAPVEIAMPEVTAQQIPEFPQIDPRQPEVPEPPQPQPQPGPMQPPGTPQPGPMPQPPIIPTPQPAPVPAPTPQPQPAPMPQPTPAPAPEPPGPAEPGTGAETAPATRQLSPDQIAAGKGKSTAFGIFGAIVGFIALSILLGTEGSHFDLGTLIFVGGFSFLAVHLIRQAIYTSAVTHVRMAPMTRAHLGAELPFEIAVGTLRDLTVSDAELTVTAVERAVHGSGKSRTVYRNVLYTRTMPLHAAGGWQGGRETILRVRVPLPATGIPSFSGRNNHIEWSANLWVGIPGWYPDIRRQTALQVPALQALAPPMRRTTNRYRLPELGDLRASLALDCALGEMNMPILAAGSVVPFTISIQPPKEEPKQRVVVELAYHISGSGDNESGTVARIDCFPNGWRGGVVQEESGSLKVPEDGPITFEGRHIRVHWSLTVRQQIPWQVDHRQTFEVLVVPGQAGG